MQGLVFEPVGYFDDKLKRRAKKKRGDIPSNSTKLQRTISSISACSTPTKPNNSSSNHSRTLSHTSSPFNKSCSSLISIASNRMYQPTSLKTSLSNSNHNSPIPSNPINSPKSDHSSPNSHNSHRSHHHRSHRHHHHHKNGKTHSRKRSGSGSSTHSNRSNRSNRSHKSNKSNKSSHKISKIKEPEPKDDILEAYKKRLKRKKIRRTRSLNSNGVTALLNVEKERITKDKFSRLFHDFESTKLLINKSERDQLFRSKLKKLNEKKKKNKSISYELIRQYFDSILDKKYSNHPLALLITKFCNFFHGHYSFSPQDFKNKSIYQISDQKRLKRKGNKRSTSDIFDDSATGIKHQSKVVRKTSRRLDKAIEDVKNFISKLRSLIITLYPELKALRTYKYVVQSVFHKELFQQLTPTLGDLYSIKTEDKQSEFAKYMGIWKLLTCRDYGVNDAFTQFCLIPSLRPLLLSKQKELEKELEIEGCINNNNNQNENKEQEMEGSVNTNVENENNDTEQKEIEETTQTVDNQIETQQEPELESETKCHDSESKEMSGLSKQLEQHNMSSYSQLDPIIGAEEEDEKESEIIHNAEPDISDNNNNNSSELLTEERLKEFDENYAITVLDGAGIDTLNNENINTNFTRPEYINEYNMELDYDDETFNDILSSGSSYRRSPNPNLNDINLRQKERELNNVLNMSSPTISSISSMDGVYELNDINSIYSSPDSNMTYASNHIKTINNCNIKSDYIKSENTNIKSIINNPKIPKNNININIKPKKSRWGGSILGVFSKKKNKNKNIAACDIKITNYDKYDNMNAATKLIEAGISNQRKTPQQFLSLTNKQRRPTPNPLITPMKTPKISIRPQNEHQENHPTPPSKRINNKNNKNKLQFKDNINNITQKMLAGSHAGKIANQLHNRNNDKSDIKSIEISDNKNNNKIIKVVKKKNKLDNINENPNSNSNSNILDSKCEEEKDANMPYFENEEDKGHNPYMSAVLEIKKMPSYDTPEDKIQCVVRTADIIRDCIDKYYENRRTDPVQITPDDLLSLFAYILVQANLHCLWAEVDLIDDFVVDNLRMDMPGYYIATLRAAMQLIVNDIEKLTDMSTKKRNSINTNTNK